MMIEYWHNNSGGRWWLKDEDWQALRDAGWEVENHNAYKPFKSIKKAKEEFAKLTGQDPDARGCLCCGRPHNFSEAGE